MTINTNEEMTDCSQRIGSINVVMIGPPGSGKGTHGPYIRDALCICHLATGDMLREAIEAGTELGKTAESIMKRGELVSDELVIGLIKEKIGSETCSRGILFDGFPRTIKQAEMLDTLLEKKNLSIERVLEFQVDEEKLLERIEGRRIHLASGRSYHLKFNPPKIDGVDDVTGEPLIHRKDDTKEALSKRMNAYHENTMPILDYYRDRGNLETLNATAAINVV